VWDQLRQSDWRAFQRFLGPPVWLEAAKVAGVKLGKGPLHLGNLVWLALGAAWFRTKNFADVLVVVLKLLRDAEDYADSPLAELEKRGKQKAKKEKRHKHDPRGQDPTKLSEEAFTQARRKMPTWFWVALLLILTRNFEKAHRERIRWKRFRLLTIDGTTIPLEHWQNLAKHFGTAKNGRGRRRPQARLVMMQLPLVRVPWRYELVPCKQDERAVAKRLLNELERDDLLLMDRGFWSYGLFWQIQNRGAYFAPRFWICQNKP